ncbi:MAG: hypothetical protein ABSA92_05545 [Candidatus Bathyarchaeia archaeon]|jgi:hypothetical protein
MNLIQVKREITELGKTPASEKLYPITSEWVPLPDVMAIISRFEQHWRERPKKDENLTQLMNEILGQT